MAYDYDDQNPPTYCVTCGQMLEPGARFCPNCGAAAGPNAAPNIGPGMADGSGAGYGAPAHVPNYLVWAILATICCCLPTGIVAIVFAAQVNGKLASGDYAGALGASRNARTWCWVSFGIGILSVVIHGFLGMASFLSRF